MTTLFRAATLLVLAVPLSAQAAGADERQAGQQLFTRHCATCHGSMKLPGTFGLHLKYRGEVPADLRQRTDLTREAVAAFVRHGVGNMPPFRKTEISDAELNAIGAYLEPDP